MASDDDTDLALFHAHTAVDLLPDVPIAYELRGIVLRRCGKGELAVVDLLKALELNRQLRSMRKIQPTILAYATTFGDYFLDVDDTYFELAMATDYVNVPQQIEKDAERFIREDTEYSTANGYAARGAIQEVLGRFDEAATNFSRAIQLEESSGFHQIRGFYQRRALVYLKAQRFNEALNDFRTRLEFAETAAELHIDVAEVRKITDSSLLDSVISYFAKYTSRWPYDGVGHIVMGEIYERIANHTEAIESFTKAIEVAQPHEVADIHYLRSQSYIALQRFVDARKDYIQYLKLRRPPESANEYDVKYFVDSLPEADIKPFLEECAAITYRDALTPFAMAIVYQSLGEHDKAISLLQNALALQPAKPMEADMYRALGQSYVALERFSDAYNILVEKNKYGVHQTHAYFEWPAIGQIANFYYLQADYTRAIECYLRQLRISSAQDSPTHLAR
jgi:tetratricopeptide (TPR) repeat protein